jgi:hypothetical protein
MYQFEFRPGFGRELAAQQLKQHEVSQPNSSSLESAGSFQLSFLFTKRRISPLTLALLTGCAVSILAGCGGVTRNSSPGALALSTISCGAESATGTQSMACSVNLSSAAMNSTTVTLSSSNAALSVPTTVVVAAGANTAGFNAVSEAVSQSVSVTITGEAGGVTKTQRITLYPLSASAPGAGTLSKISCEKQTLSGPTTDACSVYLSAAAGSQTVVTLSSSSSDLKVPASVNVPAGETNVGFSATALAVSSPEKAKLTATADGVSQMDAITLSPDSSPAPAPVATLSKISCDKKTLTGPTTDKCSVSLTAAATDKTVVTLSSSNGALKVPTSVDVHVGETDAAFSVTASAVSSQEKATLTATADGVSQMDAITLSPGTSSTPAPVATLNSISCGKQTLTGPTTDSCSVSLSAAATSQTVVTLSSSNSALKVPASVSVAEGSTSAAFSATASAVTTAAKATLTATADGVSQTDAITLSPAASPTPAPVATLSTISCATQTLTGPATDSCSVSLSAAATNQTVVTLSSSSSALTVPASVTVAAGSTNAAFNATALAVTTAAKATLTATAGGVSQTDVVQLDAPAAQPATQLEVQLNWDAPASTSDPVVGYNVYRSASGTSNYALVSSSTDTQTSYDDTTVTSGVTYDYIVKSIDSEGVESAPSNTISITVP